MPKTETGGSNPKAAAGRFAYEGLDRVMHEKARLGIMTSLLAAPEGLAFTDLKELCGLTDGNLNRHLEVLQEAGLVDIRKDQRQRRARTFCELTATGRKKFLQYIAELERVVVDAASLAKATARQPRRGWSPA